MMMSTEDDEAADTCCASCGITAVDEIKLKKCPDCDLVKYCSDGCQEKYREQHEEECRKRKAELRDRDLFEQPERSCYGDCPICCLPLTIDERKSTMMSCCCKTICKGCNYANVKREIEQGLEHRCAFCREPMPKSPEEGEKRVMERIKKNDPVAMCRIAQKRKVEGDYKTALKYLTKAAELGDAIAHYELSCLYHKGQGVEKNKKTGEIVKVNKGRIVLCEVTAMVLEKCFNILGLEPVERM